MSPPVLIPLAALLLIPAVGSAAETYRLPDKPIVDLIDAPPTPGVSISPDRKSMLILQGSALPAVAELAQPVLKLAGMRINPRTSGPVPARDRWVRSIAIQSLVAGSQPKLITGIAEPHLSNVEWSPDSSKFSFTQTEKDGISLWVADAAEGKARRLTPARLNVLHDYPCSWLSNSKELICQMIPPSRGAPPQHPEVASGPIVQESFGRKAASQTFEDLLQDEVDESLLDYYLLSQIVQVGMDGSMAPIGKPDAYVQTASPSPDGAHLLVVATHRPYSYRVPLERFPQRMEIWDLAGKVQKTIVDRPLATEIPIAFDAVVTGPRDLDWRADSEATLCWVEARDRGDPAVEAKVRDEVLCLAVPFTGEPTSLAKLEMRLGSLTWGSGQLALVDEARWKDRHTRTWAIAPDHPEAKPRLIWDRSSEDRYGDPGRPVLDATPRGTWVLHTTRDGSLILRGAGASTEGDRPFLDRFDLASSKSTRLWRSQAPAYESVVAILDGEAQRFVTRRESVSEPPNFFLREVSASDPGAALTHFPHPAPQAAGVHKELITYQRKDGVKLSATLYTPAGWDPKRDPPLPAVLWVYPAEFKSAKAAGQVTDSPYRFARPDFWSPLPLVLAGYAVVDNPTVPIVGEGKVEPNDSYVEQLVAGLEAAANDLAHRGIDKNRLAIGGHSYGAFTTANALAHTALFKAGIARSGAYNRTLTPFSFQSEERSLWDAPETYVKMSPLMQAKSIHAPLLLIHGASDDNNGTWPIQSERLYEAVAGLGGSIRLVELPYEAHGYRARETELHVLWEEIQWLDKFVKNPPAGPPAKVAK